MSNLQAGASVKGNYKNSLNVKYKNTKYFKITVLH